MAEVEAAPPGANDIWTVQTRQHSCRSTAATNIPLEILNMEKQNHQKLRGVYQFWRASSTERSDYASNTEQPNDSQILSALVSSQSLLNKEASLNKGVTQ